MNPNHCWYETKIDISHALGPLWRRPVVQSQNWDGVFAMNRTIFSVTWLEMMENLGFDIHAAMVFYRPARLLDELAHVDGETINNLRAFALNWLIEGKNSSMIWYEMPQQQPNPTWRTTARTPFIAWPRDSLAEIDRCNIYTRPTLVRVDMPHAIDVAEEPRLSISVRFNKFNHLSWDEMIDYMMEKDLLIPRL